MSDKLYNDAENYKELINTYINHNDREIKGFFYDHSWLSNFYVSPVYFDGVLYPSSECAYQAAKFEQHKRCIFERCSPGESKKIVRYAMKSPDSELHHSFLYDEKEWDGIKYEIMSCIVFDKFYRNKGLRLFLLNTGNKYLEETNHWSDFVWGVDYKSKRGSNWLGHILMNTREFWKNKPLE